MIDETTGAAWSRAANAGLAFRSVGAADLPFLQCAYASTRAGDMTTVDWSDDQKTAFIAMQFNAQHQHYRAHYPDAEWLVIERGGESVGRLYLERRSAEYRIIDITFLPEHRGNGLGHALLADLLDEAAATGKGVSIHVEKMNPAMRLYRRLGFATIEDNGFYDLMRWTPPASRRD